MKIAIRQLGNSQGVIIPKPLLIQLGLENEADMFVRGDSLVITKPKKKVREGWAESSKALAESGDDALVWPEFSNADDAKLKW
jgi:antitoxin MazE